MKSQDVVILPKVVSLEHEERKGGGHPSFSSSMGGRNLSLQFRPRTMMFAATLQNSLEFC